MASRIVWLGAAVTCSAVYLVQRLRRRFASAEAAAPPAALPAAAAPVLVLIECSQSSTLHAVSRTASCLGARALVLVGKSARLDDRRLDGGVEVLRCTTFGEAVRVLRGRLGVDCFCALEISDDAVPLQDVARQSAGLELYYYTVPYD